MAEQKPKFNNKKLDEYQNEYIYDYFKRYVISETNTIESAGLKVKNNKNLYESIISLDIDGIREALESGADATFGLGLMLYLNLGRAGSILRKKELDELPLITDILTLLLDSGVDITGRAIPEYRTIMDTIVTSRNISLLDLIVKKTKKQLVGKTYTFIPPNGKINVRADDFEIEFKYLETTVIMLMYGVVNDIADKMYIRYLSERTNTENERQNIKKAIISVLPRLAQYVDTKRKIKNIYNFLILLFDKDETVSLIQDLVSVNSNNLQGYSNFAFSLRKPLLAAWEDARTMKNNNTSTGGRRRRITKRRGRK